MVRHDAPRQGVVLLVVKPGECICDQLRAFRAPQNTIAMMRVESRLNALFVQLLEQCVLTWSKRSSRALGAGDDAVALFLPAFEHLLWKRIGKAKGDGVNRTWVRPMGKVGALADLQLLSLHGRGARATG